MNVNRNRIDSNYSKLWASELKATLNREVVIKKLIELCIR